MPMPLSATAIFVEQQMPHIQNSKQVLPCCLKRTFL